MNWQKWVDYYDIRAKRPPRRAGVYFIALIDESDRFSCPVIAYVGCSNNLQGRFVAHRRNWMDKARDDYRVLIRWIECKSGHTFWYERRILSAIEQGPIKAGYRYKMVKVHSLGPEYSRDYRATA